MRSKKFFVVTWPVLALSVLLFVVSVRSQEQKPKVTTKARPFDETRFPIADYAAAAAAAPTDPAERTKQLARGKKYDDSRWGVHPNAVSDSTVRLDSIDPNLPALPFKESSAVVVGQVTNAQAFLSNDKASVYSVFTVQINEVLKNSTRISLSPASVIEVERDGGRVRFPNGRLHMYMIADYDMPKVGLRYVLFLNNDELGFQIITGL
jgi:hypothetical protein